MDLAKELPPRGARGISLGDTFSPEKYASSHIFVLVNILGSFDSLGQIADGVVFPLLCGARKSHSRRRFQGL